MARPFELTSASSCHNARYKGSYVSCRSSSPSLKIGLVICPCCPYNSVNRVADGGKTVTNVIENERWRVADRAADYLSVDREVCRRAFHRETEERVHEVVRWILSERDLPEYDPERMIERWAREQGAGVYAQNHRTGGLEHLEEVLVRTIFGREPAA